MEIWQMLYSDVMKSWYAIKSLELETDEKWISWNAPIVIEIETNSILQGQTCKRALNIWNMFLILRCTIQTNSIQPIWIYRDKRLVFFNRGGLCYIYTFININWIIIVQSDCPLSSMPSEKWLIFPAWEIESH